MDRYAADLHHELRNMIDRMVNCRYLYVKNPGKDFTRRFKLPLDRMLKFLIQMQARSIPHELGEYFSYKYDMPTASAFIQQRNKICDYALPALFSVWAETHPARKMANGYRLIACDGSDVYFSANPREKNCYFENEGAQGYCLAHLNALQDVIGGTYLDAIVQDRRCENEIDAMITMVERQKWDEKTIFIADRGYECYKLMAHIQERGQYYVLRVKSPTSNGILSAGLTFPANTQFDQSVSITLTRKQTNDAKARISAFPERYRIVPKDSSFDLCDLNRHLYYDMTFRVVCVKLSNDSYEYLVTNLPRDEFPSDVMKEIYHLRWNIETSFRHLKYAIGMNAFHTKKAEFIRQEIFARLILHNFCQLVASHAAIFHKSKDGLRLYKLNFSMVIGACRELLKSPLDDPPDTIAAVSRFLVSVRPDMHFKRNIKQRKPVDAFYRIA